ncbi:MAG: preprotein translocase subunit YajC [Candidatus Omnitrophica bacterium]|nr:preprotein translocase subunit YajC [Candidatus Omnitrophota bacterium]
MMGAPGNPLLNLMPVVLIFIVFYFLLIRPQKKTQDEHKKMVAGLKKNDEVITAGGIHGTIMNVKDNTVTLKVDDNVKVEVQKSSVTTMKRKAGGE